jgi:hypothetical protein
MEHFNPVCKLLQFVVWERSVRIYSFNFPKKQTTATSMMMGRFKTAVHRRQGPNAGEAKVVNVTGEFQVQSIRCRKRVFSRLPQLASSASGS